MAFVFGNLNIKKKYSSSRETEKVIQDYLNVLSNLKEKIQEPYEDTKEKEIQDTYLKGLKLLLEYIANREVPLNDFKLADEIIYRNKVDVIDTIHSVFEGFVKSQNKIISEFHIIVLFELYIELGYLINDYNLDFLFDCLQKNE